MFKSVLLFVCVICTIEAYSTKFDQVLNQEWKEFKARFKKIYENIEEDRFRFNIFLQSKLKVTKHNLEFVKGLHSYEMGMNHLSDLTIEEFRKLNGFRLSNVTIDAPTFVTPNNVAIPDEVDWRKEGYVTKVKDQGQCGSCWAFSATGALEGQQFRKAKKLVSLSEQNLVDCSLDFDNNGCEGGLPINAFKYVKKYGIDTEESYPYEAIDDICRFSEKNVGAHDSGFLIAKPNEQALKEFVATVGPISVGIDASQPSFRNYKSGVYTDDNCSSTRLDHGVLVVGYGTTDGKDYWIVKNSWGENWGDNGYIKMARNRNNMCGIATMASYPIVK